jgi:hypothetical protein
MNTHIWIVSRDGKLRVVSKVEGRVAPRMMETMTTDRRQRQRRDSSS